MEQRPRGSATRRSAVADRFNHGADAVTNALGSLPALLASVLLVVAWALTGPIFHFSDTWQLFINTTTTVVTFWMVFVIQNSANRASKATQLKLDELIRSIENARNEFIALDTEPEEVLLEREKEFHELVGNEVPGDPRGESPRSTSRSSRAKHVSSAHERKRSGATSGSSAGPASARSSARSSSARRS